MPTRVESDLDLAVVVGCSEPLSIANADFRDRNTPLGAGIYSHAAFWLAITRVPF
jgi:hypothetical protein